MCSLLQATRRLAKLPPPPRAELLKQQQDEEERRRAAAAAKLADIERRIALRKEAEARAAADLAAATAAAEELAAPAASEGGDIYGAEGQQPDSSAGGTAVAEHSVAQLAAPTPEPAAPPNAWVKPLTLANGVLEPEHPLSALGAVEVSAAQVMQGSEELPEVETGTFVNHPPAADSTTQSEPQRGSGSAAAGPSAHAGEHAEVVRNQRSQRGRGRAKAERLYEPEPPDRCRFIWLPMASFVRKFVGVRLLKGRVNGSYVCQHTSQMLQARSTKRPRLTPWSAIEGQCSSAPGGRLRCGRGSGGGHRGPE